MEQPASTPAGRYLWGDFKRWFGRQRTAIRVGMVGLVVAAVLAVTAYAIIRSESRCDELSAYLNGPQSENDAPGETADRADEWRELGCTPP